MFWLLLALSLVDSSIYALPQQYKPCNPALDVPLCIANVYFHCVNGFWAVGSKCPLVFIERRGGDDGKWHPEKYDKRKGERQHGKDSHHGGKGPHNHGHHHNKDHHNKDHHHKDHHGGKPPEQKQERRPPEQKHEVKPPEEKYEVQPPAEKKEEPGEKYAEQPEEKYAEQPGGGGDNKESADFMISMEEFQKAISACGYTTKVTKSQYDGFKKQVTKNSGIKTKTELAMFLTQVLWESGGLAHKIESRCTKKGACDKDYRLKTDNPKRHYFGRGYIQLTWSYNYKKCSEDIYGDDRLLKHPEKVAESDELSWATAAWFWKHQVHPKLKGDMFGLTTQYINGFLECKRFRKTDQDEDGAIAPGPNAAKAKLRFANYEKIYAALGLSGEPHMGGCLVKIPPEFTKPAK